MKFNVQMLASGKPGEIREVEVPEEKVINFISPLLSAIFCHGQNEEQKQDHPSVFLGDVIELNNEHWLVMPTGFKNMSQAEYLKYLSLSPEERILSIYKKDPEGIFLKDLSFAEWPTFDGKICIRDNRGNTKRTISRDGEDAARWKEIRDLMPDDALYFQPDEAGDPDCGTSAATIKSFDVYRDYENAKKAHPDCEIMTFIMYDIEDPRFLDVKEPKLAWNNQDTRL